MDFQHRMKRTAVGTLVRRSIRQLNTDPQRALRQLADLGQYSFKGEGQKRFIAAVQQSIRCPNSPWYDLILRVASTASPKTLQRLSVNLGYTSCTYGVRLLRAQQEVLRHVIPALLVYDCRGEKQNFLCEKIPSLIEEAKELGVFTHVFVLDESFAQLNTAIKQAQLQEECTFAYTLPAALITPETAAQLSQLPNCMILLIQNGKESTTQACRLLKENRCVFGFALAVQKAGFDPAALREQLLQKKEEGAFYEMLIASPDQPELCKGVAAFVAECRKDPQLSIFPVDWQHDIPYVTQAFSRGNDYLVFCRDGSIYNGKRTASGRYESTLRRAIMQTMPQLDDFSEPKAEKAEN